MSIRKTRRNILESLPSFLKGIGGVKRLILQVLSVLLATDLALAEQGRTLYSLEEVSEFFLANNPNQTEEYFDEMLANENFETLARNDCFGTYWEYRLASSKGHSSSFSHALCRDRSVSRNAYQRWYESHKQAVTQSNASSDVTSSSSPSWMTSFAGRPYAKQKTNTSSASSTDSIDEVAAFFLSSSGGYSRTQFDRAVAEDPCFLPLWESALARSKGQPAEFDLDYCKTLATPKIARVPKRPDNDTDHPPSVKFFIRESGRTAEDYKKLPQWAKDQWAVWHSQGSTATSPVYTRQTYNESKSKEKSDSWLERAIWGYIEYEIDCKIGECAERERLLRDVEAAAARGAARGSRANSRRYYDSKGRPVPQNNSPQPLRTGPYCSGPYAGDCD